MKHAASKRRFWRDKPFGMNISVNKNGGRCFSGNRFYNLRSGKNGFLRYPPGGFGRGRYFQAHLIPGVNPVRVLDQ